MAHFTLFHSIYFIALISLPTGSDIALSRVLTIAAFIFYGQGSFLSSLIKPKRLMLEVAIFLTSNFLVLGW